METHLLECGHFGPVDMGDVVRALPVNLRDDHHEPFIVWPHSPVVRQRPAPLSRRSGSDKESIVAVEKLLWERSRRPKA